MQNAGMDEFFLRFGFRQMPDFTLTGIPPKYFMAMPICGNVASGAVRFHDSFG